MLAADTEIAPIGAQAACAVQSFNASPDAGPLGAPEAAAADLLGVILGWQVFLGQHAGLALC